MTAEHLIPEALGGRLTARFLCSSCNSKLGHRLEGNAKTDPTIRLLVAKLSASIPGLSRTLTEGQSFVSTGPGGKSRGRIKSGEFVVSAEKRTDGSLVQATSLGRRSIKKMLQQEGHSEQSIADALRLFDEAPENARVTLSPTLEAVKWQVTSIEPSLEGSLLNPLVPLKSAFEFLALHVGNAIYEDAPALTAVRSALTGGPLDPNHIQVERLNAPSAKPFHGLLFEGNEPHARVQVRLFGQLVYRVHFLLLSVGGGRGMYTHDLSTNAEYVAKLPE